MPVLRTSNLQAATIRLGIRPTDRPETETLYFLYCSPVNFFSARAFTKKYAIIIILSLCFQNERLESRNVTNETKPNEKFTENNKRNKTRQETNYKNAGLFTKYLTDGHYPSRHLNIPLTGTLG